MIPLVPYSKPSTTRFYNEFISKNNHEIYSNLASYIKKYKINHIRPNSCSQRRFTTDFFYLLKKKLLE